MSETWKGRAFSVSCSFCGHYALCDSSGMAAIYSRRRSSILLVVRAHLGCTQPRTCRASRVSGPFSRSALLGASVPRSPSRGKRCRHSLTCVVSPLVVLLAGFNASLWHSEQVSNTKCNYISRSALRVSPSSTAARHTTSSALPMAWRSLEWWRCCNCSRIWHGKLTTALCAMLNIKWNCISQSVLHSSPSSIAARHTTPVETSLAWL